jgi:riboflavin synthase
MFEKFLEQNGVDVDTIGQATTKRLSDQKDK